MRWSLGLIDRRPVTKVPPVAGHIAAREVLERHDKRCIARCRVGGKTRLRSLRRTRNRDRARETRRAARTIDGQAHRVHTRIHELMNRVLIRAGRAVTEFPEPRCDLALRRVGVLDRQRRDTAGVGRREVRLWRRHLRIRDGHDTVSAARPTRPAYTQRDIVRAFCREYLTWAALVGRGAITEVPTPAINRAGGSIRELHGKR